MGAWRGGVAHPRGAAVGEVVPEYAGEEAAVTDEGDGLLGAAVDPGLERLDPLG